MRDMTADIRAAARRLFAEKKVDVLVGFERGSDGYRARPAFLGSAVECDRLTWDATCSNNLGVYLTNIFQRPPQRKGVPVVLPKAGFVVKGCDLRSVVALVKEKQAPRENLVLIGVPCRGMIDEGKLAAAAGGAQVVALADGEAKVEAVLADGRTLSLEREPLVQEACLVCQFPAPEGVDISIEGESRKTGDNGDGLVKAFAALAASERWQRFQQEISRCIRCYACRQACPTCYCKECFAEMNSPAWIGASTELTDASIFHLIRIFHQAGRCVECDACVRACPLGIDLRTFTKKMAADVRELYGFTPGFDLETPPPLVTFRDEDAQEFITEPHKP
jgi:formate dehydrogenase (coenzyme F420) beta subunit